MFERARSDEMGFSSIEELKDFPALSTLGEVHGVWPGRHQGDPRTIRVLVGTRIKGFIIEIPEKSKAGKFQKDPSSLEVAPGIVVYTFPFDEE